MTGRKLVTQGYLAIPPCLALFAGIFLFVPQAPYSFLREALDGLAPDGRAEFFTEAFHATMRWMGLAGGVLTLVAAYLLWRHRRRGQSALADWVLKSFAAPGAFGAFLRDEFARYFASVGRIHLAVLCTILLAGFVLRVRFYLTVPLHADEAYTFVSYALGPSWKFWLKYTYPNNHLLNTVLVHGAYVLFGPELWSLRLPSLAAGVLICPVSYLVVRIFYGAPAALIAAAFVSVSSIFIEYSSVARGYSLLALSFLLLVGASAHILRGGFRLGVPLFALFTAMGFYAMPPMLYGFGTMFLWLLWSGVRAPEKENRARIVLDALLATALGAALTLILYAPTFYLTGVKSITENRFVRQHSDTELPELWWTMVQDTVSLFHRDLPIIVILPLALGFCVALAVRRGVARFPIGVHWAALAWVVPILVLQRVIPYPRIFTIFLPIYVGAGAAGLLYLFDRLAPRSGLHKERAAAALSLAVLALGSVRILAGDSIYETDQDTWLAEPEALVLYLKDTLEPEDKVLVVSASNKIVQYYAGIRGLSFDHFLFSYDARDFYVVVNEREHDLEGTLNVHESFTAGPNFSERLQMPPEVVRRFGTTVLYKIALDP